MIRAAFADFVVEVTMTGDELRAIRETLGLSASQLGRALGYSGATANISVQIRRFERGDRPIPRPIERLALMFRREGIPEGWAA